MPKPDTDALAEFRLALAQLCDVITNYGCEPPKRITLANAPSGRMLRDSLFGSRSAGPLLLHLDAFVERKTDRHGHQIEAFDVLRIDGVEIAWPYR
jgi:hypothetical protein